jgi:hydrogenase maturation protease
MLTVIGCGNPVRGDDGVGVEVIRRLRIRFEARPGAVRLIDAGTSGMEVMYQVKAAAQTLIVDACNSGSEPGAVFRLPGSEAKTPVEHGYSLHGLRWDHALYAGSRMYGDEFVRGAEVFLIEAQSLGFGTGLSQAAERGVARVVAEIEALVETQAEAERARPEAWLRNGRLHFSRAGFERHLRDCVSVGLLARDGEWLLLPLRAGAGGLQIKLRNASGDRAIEAQEFFRAQGLEDSADARPLSLVADTERGVLRITFERGT